MRLQRDFEPIVYSNGPVFRSADDDLYQHVYKNIKVIDTSVRYILTKQCLWHYVQVIWRAAKLLVVPNETVHRWTIRTWFDIDVYKNNGILIAKLFWTPVRKNCFSDWEKLLKFDAKEFEITRTMHSNNERSKQFLETECFFNLFMEIFQI